MVAVKRHSHWLGWCTIVAVVAIADKYGDRTMSTTFRSLARHRLAGPVIYGVWAGLTMHLFLPSDQDPVRFMQATANDCIRALRPGQMSVFDFTDDDTSAG